MYEYSVVIPVFNSELTLEKLMSGLKSTFADEKKTAQYIFVDDGSFDKSWEVLEKIKSENPEAVSIVRFNKNYGQGNATFCGMELADGKFIITMDDDLQQPPSEVKSLITAINEGGWDLVYGVYDKKRHSTARNIGSSILRKTAGRFLDRPERTTSFKIVKREVVKKILPHKSHFIFIDELLWWYTDSISYVVVEHVKRTHSKSGYTPGKLWKMFTNLVIFYSNFPLKLMIYGGLFFSTVFLVSILGFLVAKAMNNVPLGYTSIIVTILFGTSIILLSLGVIGEYISRLYSFQNKKPPFIIKEIKK